MRLTVGIFLSFFVLATSASAQIITFNKEAALRYENYLPADSSSHHTIRNFDVNEYYLSEIKNKRSLNRAFFSGNLYSKKFKETEIHINPLLLSRFSYSENYKYIRYGTGLAGSLEYNDWTLRTNLFAFRDNYISGTNHFADSFNIIPAAGKVMKSEKSNYTVADALFRLTYSPAEIFDFEIGKGKTFLGNGYRSLLLSDNSASYPYFRASAEFWRLKYFWQIGKLKDYPLHGTAVDFKLYDKHAFWHYLSINLGKRINFNFFEVIISNPYGHKLEKTGVNLAYLNPLVLYRPVEFAEGTVDNALLGAGFNIRLFKSLHLYSQFILDDIILSTLNDGSGWWANKFGLQAGLKAYNFLNIKNLYLLAELNAVRPYTYSHGDMDFTTMPSSRNMNLNYGNKRQAFAHPLGANFAEALLHAGYLHGCFHFTTTASFSVQGIDTERDLSMGKDIYKSYWLRPDNYGITYLQGEQVKTMSGKARFSYIINPLTALEAAFQVELQKLSGGKVQEFLSISLSSNIF